MLFPSCSDQSRCRESSVIGTAPPTQCFVMIECPQPWGKTIQDAKFLPPALQAMTADAAYRNRNIRFFLISNGETIRKHRVRNAAQNEEWRILVFNRPRGLASGYGAKELWVPTLEEGAVALKHYFAGHSLDYPTQSVPTRDLFICTHGQRDRCCGHYGYPFFRDAQALTQEWGIPNLRLWQISHIGGHRFAPTLIDLPQGRYYGRMDLDRLKLLVLQQGDWRSLLHCYRGWSLLSTPLQCLEHLLWRNQGWQWLTQSVDYQYRTVGEDHHCWQTRFIHQDREGAHQEWWAEILEEDGAIANVIGSCGDTHAAPAKTYTVTTLQAADDVAQIVA